MSINRILADLGKAVDSSSTGNFLNKEAAGAEFNPVQWSDINSAPTILDSALASAIVDSAYVQLRQTGVGSGGIDSATTIALIDSSYVGARASTGGSGFVKYQYTATASQTTFQDSDANGNVLSYDADYILVHYNGVLLPSADYTATDGSSVVLATAADSGSIIGIAKWGAAAGSGSGGGASFTWGGDRGIHFIGRQGTPSTDYSNIINYFDITTPGNASDFGDLSQSRQYPGSLGDGTYALAAGGWIGSSTFSSIEYVTVASTSNASSFGNLTSVRNFYPAGACDGTTGVFAGGADVSQNELNNMDYVTVATPGNASDFGDLSVARMYHGAASDATYGLWGKGYSGSGGGSLSNLEYAVLATTGNASSFGSLSVVGYDCSGCSDATRACFNGGIGGLTGIEYVTTATTGNGTDFGDLNVGVRGSGACSNGTTAVVSGGRDASIYNVMQYYVIQTTGNASDFGDLTVTGDWGASTSGSPS